MGVRRNRISQVHARDFMDALNNLPIRLNDPPAYDEVFVLATRFGPTVYDAAYLDLAIRAALPLATFDSALLGAAGRTSVGIFQPQP